MLGKMGYHIYHVYKGLTFENLRLTNQDTASLIQLSREKGWNIFHSLAARAINLQERPFYTVATIDRPFIEKSTFAFAY